MAKSNKPISAEEQGAFVSDLLMRVTSARPRRGFDTYFLLSDGDLRKLIALDQLMNWFIIPNISEIRRLAVQKMRDRS